MKKELPNKLGRIIKWLHKNLDELHEELRRIHIMKKKSTNSKFMAPMELSADLEGIVGKGPMPRTEVTKKIWAYIKKNKLQDPNNKRNIIPDQKLARLFGTSQPVDMFKMTSLISKHIKSEAKLAGSH